jgi:thiamine biosynthesis protein ThiI
LKNNENKKVKLKNPDAEFFVEILGKHAFCYQGKNRGAGGLPVGSAGKGLALLSGGIDSPVAYYFMAKRGMNISFIHFHSYPQTSKKSVDKVRELVQKLTKFYPNLNLYMCPFLEIQKEILKNIPDKFRIIFYRRIMLQIAEKLAQKIKAKGLITGESLSQVASQTIENMTVIQEVVELMPVLRPLVGFDKSEIIHYAKKIDTFQISIKPHDDCCTVFMPKSPETKGRLLEVLSVEKKLDIEGLVELGLQSIELEKISRT